MMYDPNTQIYPGPKRVLILKYPNKNPFNLQFILFIKMISDSQSNGLSQVGEFQQCPDGGVYVKGMDELGQPLTQLRGSPPSQFSMESQVNTFLDYQLTCQDTPRT